MSAGEGERDVATDFDVFDDEDDVGGPGAGAYLVVRFGDGARVLDLTDGVTITFGRTAENTVAIDEGRVSRKHAEIRRKGNHLTLTDLGSRNGTRVNGVAVHGDERRLKSGDVLRIGGAEIVVAAGVGTATPPTVGATAADRFDAPAEGVVVADPKMREVFVLARRLAAVGTTVLVLGETGVGKEVVASQIHRHGARAAHPFVRLNCASIPEPLLESELFGHERGAFTGADRQKIGYVEAAQGGTLFLDEIGELPPNVQVKLLLVLENRVVTRLGGTREIPVDVRVICATHRDLAADVREKRFREDLYYRVAAFVLKVPPLRERPADVSLLADLFAREFAHRMGEATPTFDPAAAHAIAAYAWPGNVRELRNAMEHAVVLAEGGVVRVEHLPEAVLGRPAMGAPAAATAASSMRERLADSERRDIEAALAAEGGNQTRAAKRLGVSRRALIYKIAKYNLR